MDTNKCLILLKNEGKTKDVLSFDHQGAMVMVNYNKGPAPYHYWSGDLIYRENPILVDLTDKVLYYHNTPLMNIERMMVFGDKAKIVFAGNQSKVYDFQYIRMESGQEAKSGTHNTFSYWKEISKHTVTASDENVVDKVGKEAFLEKEYTKINSIDPKSVLSCYMNKESLTTAPISNDGIIFPFRFNLSQKQALDNALSSNISVIEGPPGTGKTQTILNIIANLVMQNKTVAIVSGNNAAVQNVKEKLVKDDYHFLAASLGNTKNREHFFNNIPSYKLTDWEIDFEESKHITAEINSLNGSIHRLMELNNLKAKAQQKLSQYQLEQQHFNHYYDKQDIEKIKRLPFYRKTPQSIISFLADNHLAKEQQKSDGILYKAKLFFNMDLSISKA